MLENLASLNYSRMTPVQARSLPAILQGRDVIAKAKTGSGKTAAFSIGLLQRLNLKDFAVQGLVICPTRELADQVSKEIRRLARTMSNVKVLTLCGGMPLGPQIGSLEHGAHIVVGTPGRLLEHINKGRLVLAGINTLVLDEADRMLDMGFYPDIATIAESCPPQRQTLLFSATFPDDIQSLSRKFQENPLLIEVESEVSHSQISQQFYRIEKDQREEAIVTLLNKFNPGSAVIFCNTKVQTETIASALRGHGYAAMALHGDMDQRERDQALVRFANQSLHLLVATDVAARGLDIKELPMVINAELTRDAEVHVHRVGRTGRAGQDGMAISLLTASEQYKLDAIAAYQNLTCEVLALPPADEFPLTPESPPMVTLQLDAGKKSKLRPGDILGALTGEGGIAGSEVGKIDIFDFTAYVAVRRDAANRAVKRLESGKVKGRSVKVRKLR